jgi:uncharacterized protein YjbI with pentapeptide repeats
LRYFRKCWKDIWGWVKDNLITFLFLILLFTLILYIIISRYLFGFTVWLDFTGFSGKSLWEWLDLLGAPILIAFIAWRFEVSQTKREHFRISEENKISHSLEDKKLDITKKQIRFSILNNALDEIYNIKATNDIDILENAEGSIKDLARSKILSTILMLDSIRNRIFFDYLQSTKATIDFSESKLNFTKLVDCDLTKLNFSNSELRKALCRNTIIDGTDFRNAKLNGADFLGAKGNNTNFSCAVIMGAEFGSSKLSHAKFIKAEIQGVSFERADLSFADFTDAIIDDDTDFKDAKFCQTKMHDGTIKTSPGL